MYLLTMEIKVIFHISKDFQPVKYPSFNRFIV